MAKIIDTQVTHLVKEAKRLRCLSVDVVMGSVTDPTTIADRMRLRMAKGSRYGTLRTTLYKKGRHE
jgi:hypothetical protein